MGEDVGWVNGYAWRRAETPAQYERDRRDYLFFDVVVDQDLGAIAVARLPDGREVYGADDARPSPSSE